TPSPPSPPSPRDEREVPPPHGRAFATLRRTRRCTRRAAGGAGGSAGPVAPRRVAGASLGPAGPTGGRGRRLVPDAGDDLGQAGPAQGRRQVARPELAHALAPGRGHEPVRPALAVDAQRAVVLVVLVDPHVGAALAHRPPGKPELVDVDGPGVPLEPGPAADLHERSPPLEQVGRIAGR